MERRGGLWKGEKEEGLRERDMEMERVRGKERGGEGKGERG